VTGQLLFVYAKELLQSSHYKPGGNNDYQCCEQTTQQPSNRSRYSSIGWVGRNEEKNQAEYYYENFVETLDLHLD
jgi:hypothetical protein